MKKRGFTLIELIVVIAIIAVLISILTPALLGYVRKSKITTANSTANEIKNAINSLLADDNQDDVFSNLGDNDYFFNTTTYDQVGNALETVIDSDGVPITDFIGEYNDSVAGEQYTIYVKDGVVVACAVKNGKYYGTSPIAFTNSNYDEKMDGKFTMKQALDLAKEVAGVTED